MYTDLEFKIKQTQSYVLLLKLQNDDFILTLLYLNLIIKAV